MSPAEGYFQSTQLCPRCRRVLSQAIISRDTFCPWPGCGYRRQAPPPNAITLGVHGRGNFELLRPRLERLTERLQIGRLVTLYDDGSRLALDWSLQLEVELTHYQCGARMAGCAYVIVVGRPRRPLEEITQGVPHRLLDPARKPR